MSSGSDKYSRIEYRRLIAWPRRIEREAPLLEKVLSTGPSRRLLDVGCGTGEHSRFLVSRGYEVVGVDSSPSMLAAAREQPLEPGLEFVEGDIRQLATTVEGRFGGAICLGNTLPHLEGEDDLEALLAGLRARLQASAPLVLQLLNYERIFQRGERHLPLNFRPDEKGEIVFLRLMQLEDNGEVLFFPSTLELDPEADPPLTIKTSKKVRLRGWRVGELEAALDRSGFRKRLRFGAFDESRFEPAESRDLIIVARR